MNRASRKTVSGPAKTHEDLVELVLGWPRLVLQVSYVVWDPQAPSSITTLYSRFYEAPEVGEVLLEGARRWDWE